MEFQALISYLAAISSAVMAALLLWQDPRSFVHRVFAGGMGILALEAVLIGLGFQYLSYTEVVAWNRYKLFPSFLSLGIWLIFSLSFARANYREFLSRWKWILVGAFVFPLAALLLFPGEIFVSAPIFNESMRLFFRLGWSGYALYLFGLIGTILILMNLEWTLRNSIGHTRWQVKFLVLGIGSIFGARIYTQSQVILFSMLDVQMEAVNMGALLLASLLIGRSLWRVKDLNSDFYLSHSALYNSITVLLVGIYFIAVGVIARLVHYLQGSQDPAVTTFFVFLAIMGLAVFLLSDRLRLRRKRFISRHFKRPRYDYPRVWARFTERTASLTGIKELCSNIVRMVSETLETLSVNIWVWNEQKGSFHLEGSTVLPPQGGENPIISGADAQALLQTMRQQEMPLDLRKAEEPWGQDFRAVLEKSAEEAKVDLCVPLSAAGQLVGILTVGARVADEPYPFEDLEILKTVADQAAANLLTLILGERLQQAKELEAFQVMSAFFMHDLKNLASRLSLVTQNLPIHFNNAQFRNDALKTISQSLEKINGVCSRLSNLSQKLDLRPREVDLNGLVNSSLAALDGVLKGKLAVDLQPLPKLVVDPEQIQKVLTNLLLNAHEAVGEGGVIRVATETRASFASFSVSDNGCGMSRDFMERNLFRPFQTTKKQGMGIGLFHSKKIIEAHGGKIEIASEEGKGSTFRVLLPLEAGQKEKDRKSSVNPPPGG